MAYEVALAIADLLCDDVEGLDSQEMVDRWLTQVNTSLQELIAEQAAAPYAIKQRILAKVATLTALKGRVTSRVVGGGAVTRVAWEDVESAFARRIRTGVIVNLNHMDLEAFLSDAKTVFQQEVQRTLQENSAVKVNAVLTCYFVQHNNAASDPKTFNTKNMPILRTTDLSKWFDANITVYLRRDISEFQDRGSGWTLLYISHLTVNLNRYNPIRGSSYIKLPGAIGRRRACLNIVNRRDQECFRWSILAAKHPAAANGQRVCHYEPFKNELEFGQLEFPIHPKQTPKFEKLNPTISVNIFALEKRSQIFKVVPIYVTSEPKALHVNLLLIQNHYVDEDADSDASVGEEWTPLCFHYVLIKDLSRLVSTQVSRRHGKIHVCPRCLHAFKTLQQLESHGKDCLNTCRTSLPKGYLTNHGHRDDEISFRNFKNKEFVPFLVFADFECLLKPTEKEQGTNTRSVNEHIPFSAGYYVHCSFNEDYSGYHSYRGESPAAWLADQLVLLARQVQQLYDNPLPLQPTDEEQRQFDTAKECHICEKPFMPGDIKAFDHDHLTGRARGASHQSCNLNFKIPNFIPVIFHNFSHYDAHIVIKEIARRASRVYVIPQTVEKYISVIQYVPGCGIQLRYIDSFRFMASSLEKLASYLPEYPVTRRVMANLSDTDFALLTRKGVFCYEYLTSWEKLEETALPPKEAFYSHLTDSHITDGDFQHAQRVWTTFNITTLGEYADLYLKTDCLLLADIFLHFRQTCFKAYGLDASHYFTAPGLSWDAMLKCTKITLELLKDPDQYLFIERGVRGGLSQCMNRYACASNPFTPDYKGGPCNYLMYFDVCNLYGFAMSQALPYKNFRWVDPLTTKWDVPDDSPVGYILEVDLAYPRELHDLHKDLPFCPELASPPGSHQKKLLATLYPKKRYVIHFRYLKQALHHGLKLEHIHRILSFHQKPWLKVYIDKNTELRKAATNDFEKNFFKLMNNSIYGKTMESVRKRVQVKLVKKWEGRYGAEAYIAKPNFHSRAIFDEDLVAIKLTATDILLNKPMYAGFSILDISKTCVYDFHYAKMYSMFEPHQVKCLYTDTDSLVYDIRHPNVYDVMKRHLDYFDTSDYDELNVHSMPRVNKKKVGLMADQFNGKIMTEFVGLRSKMYSVRVQGMEDMKKCKGIKTAIVKNHLTFQDYKKCLNEQWIKVCVQQMFRTRLHHLETIQQSKLALSPSDDKRFVRPGETDTLPWGHYDVPE